MIKQYKWTLLVTSLIILVPMVAGLILWNDLPERIATHWGPNGEPDGFSSRPFAVFGLPLIVLGLHWVCVLASGLDKKNKDRNQKVQRLVLWICPVVSLFGGTVMYAWIAAWDLRVDRLGTLLVGVMFLVVGNYLPKCQQNHTIGIKIPWTLADENNWIATHRFGGRVWMLGGVMFLLATFLPLPILPYLVLILLPVLVLVPTIYSYLYHKKHK